MQEPDLEWKSLPENVGFVLLSQQGQKDGVLTSGQMAASRSRQSGIGKN
jgi:hypothetical protein